MVFIAPSPSLADQRRTDIFHRLDYRYRDISQPYFSVHVESFGQMTKMLLCSYRSSLNEENELRKKESGPI